MRERLTYRVPREVRDALEAVDRLGFDSIRECAEAILTHEDWMDRWDVESLPGRPDQRGQVLNAWRLGTLEQNEARIVAAANATAGEERTLGMERS